MDLSFNDQEAAFRDELRAWLADNPASDAPRPPYSVGQWTPAQRPSFRRRCQSRRQAYCESSSGGASPAGLAASHSRSSSRNAASCSLKERSIGVS